MIDSASSDEEILRFLVTVKDEASADAAVAATLAVTFAKSGETLDHGPRESADVASTGGPTSLSTLLCPLFLRVAGCEVAKLGVPGRPAGGIDCLAQLPAYKTALSPSDLAAVLKQCGYAHFLAAGRYAPLDARIFQLRQQAGLQDVATLVAASLLSKKLAVGVRNVGLDIRVGPLGNFGQTWPEARVNAAMFAHAARLIDVQATPVLTDASFPYQPYVGRKEALTALYLLFHSNAGPWLSTHLELCRTIALACVPAGFKEAVAQADVPSLKAAFYANLEAQGSSASEFERLAQATIKAHTETIRAPIDGFVNYDLALIRKVLVDAQRTTASSGPFADPIGLRLLRRSGDWIRRGDPIATARVDVSNGYSAQQLSALARIEAQPMGQGFEGVKSDG